MDLTEPNEPSIIAHNSHFSVLNKPIGWTVQKDEQAPDVLTWLKQRFTLPAFPVHRLDKPTSGILLVAHDQASNRALSMAFAERRVKKTYWAISDQKPKKKQGWVKGDMEKSRRGQFKLLRSQHNPAITQFTSFAIEQGYRGFVLTPHTGKTHQLRVALKSLGAPILGDVAYGGTEAERMYLHAAEIAFNWHGELLHFSASTTDIRFLALQGCIENAEQDS